MTNHARLKCVVLVRERIDVRNDPSEKLQTERRPTGPNHHSVGSKLHPVIEKLLRYFRHKDVKKKNPHQNQ
jgi:hypothetical protein